MKRQRIEQEGIVEKPPLLQVVEIDSQTNQKSTARFNKEIESFGFYDPPVYSCSEEDDVAEAICYDPPVYGLDIYREDEEVMLVD
jgi:hypothetical protein